jgi:hypothetical protein
MGELRLNRIRRRLLPIVVEPGPGMGHNGGPPLDHVPEWGTGGIRNYFEWRTASESAFAKVPYETAIRRARKAEAIGLTYREYTLEILERGIYLQPEDTERIAAIIARRATRGRPL